MFWLKSSSAEVHQVVPCVVVLMAIGDNKRRLWDLSALGKLNELLFAACSFSMELDWSGVTGWWWKSLFFKYKLKSLELNGNPLSFLIFSGMPYVDKIQLKCGMTCAASVKSSEATSGNRNYLSMISKKIETLDIGPFKSNGWYLHGLWSNSVGFKSWNFYSRVEDKHVQHNAAKLPIKLSIFGDHTRPRTYCFIFSYLLLLDDLRSKGQ